VRYIGWAAAIGLLCALPVASANDVAGNTDELTRVLGQARKPATLNALSMVQGCGPVGCGVTLGGLVIDTDTGSVRRSNGRLLSWVPTGAVADLAEVNWEPLRGYGVRHAGRNWGQCLEFAHTGLGNSGRAQRWRTLALVPADGRTAYRFTGYWAACAALVQGTQAGEIILPTVEPVQPGASALRLVWNHCDVRRCVRDIDTRSVEGNPGSEDGRLTLR
jgi:hypothetical protein